MDDFEFIQPLSTHPHFTVFEAYAKKLGFQVVLKQCAYTTIAEVEYYVRSALIKTRNNVYSQPLLCIFASGWKTGGQSFINFVWKRGEVLDTEVESDQESLFPPGKSGLEERKTVFTNLETYVSIKRVRCLTLGKDVTCKVFKYGKMIDLNSAFNEALAHAKCSHQNTCELLDFRIYPGKQINRCAYIVMEWLEPDLEVETRKRASDNQRYDEIELMSILRDVTAGLLHAKSQGFTHGDIKLSSILRSPQGLKLANLEASWREVLPPTTATDKDTDIYISLDALETTRNPKMQQRTFESDVFSLGMTMLHLVAMELPERTPTMSLSELQALLQREVQALRYSEELKRLLTAMLSTAPSDRPPLETVQVDAERIYRQANHQLPQEAFRLGHQACSHLTKGKNAEAIELMAAAHAIFSRLPENKSTAINLGNWGFALYIMGRNAEAVEKYEAAHAIYSHVPEDKITAINLYKWGLALDNMERSAEAVERYEAAHSIHSRLPNDKHTADNLSSWGLALDSMGRSVEAVEKYAAAHAIYSRLPEDKRTAKNLKQWGFTLGALGRRAEAVEKYAAAHAIYSQFPEDNDTAYNLSEWGEALLKIRRSVEAVEKCAAAHAIYSRLSEDNDIVNNLKNWGSALRDIGRSAEAMEKYAAAHAICSRLPKDKHTAFCLSNWGNALYNTGRGVEAVKKYAAAHAIYSRLPEGKYTASNLSNWGYALSKLRRSAEAVKKYEAAHAIYSRLPEDKDTADNLSSWGLALDSMERSVEAKKKYAAAHAIYSRLPEDKDTADNLKQWGDALCKMGWRAEAVEKYEAARAIYVSCQLGSRARVCDAAIAKLR